jgi:hypothetical protein
MFRTDLLATAPIAEASPRDIRSTLASLRASRKWKSRGKSRTAILGKVDRRFIHHQEHYDRMLNGGTRPDGSTYNGAKGVTKVFMEAGTDEASITVDGSREWDGSKHAYHVAVEFSNYGLILRVPGLTFTERALLLMQDNIRVDCDCKAFQYYHRHAATEKGFALVVEERPAPDRNPRNRGGVCKHLEHALRYLPANYTAIASAMKAHAASMRPRNVAERIAAALTEGA